MAGYSGLHRGPNRIDQCSAERIDDARGLIAGDHRRPLATPDFQRQLTESAQRLFRWHLGDLDGDGWRQGESRVPGIKHVRADGRLFLFCPPAVAHCDVPVAATAEEASNGGITDCVVVINEEDLGLSFRSKPAANLASATGCLAEFAVLIARQAVFPVLRAAMAWAGILFKQMCVVNSTQRALPNRNAMNISRRPSVCRRSTSCVAPGRLPA